MMYKKPFFLNAAHAQSVRQDGITDKVPFLELFVRKNKQKLAAIAHPDPRGGKSRQKPSKISEICLPTRPKSVRAEAKVDKNRAKCLKFVYRLPKMVRASPKIVCQGGQIKCPQFQPSQPDCTAPNASPQLQHFPP